MHIILHEPEIPGNTGSVARVCAGTNTALHLSGKLGFSLEDKYVRRAGLDYWPKVSLHVHADLPSTLEAIGQTRIWVFSARAKRSFWNIEFEAGDTLLFGGESAGLPANIQAQFPEEQHLVIPTTDAIRSHNLSNAVSIALYEALRQNGGRLSWSPSAD